MRKLLQFVLTLTVILQVQTEKKSGGDLPPIPQIGPHPFPRAIWGHWRNYGPCSRTCGQGIKMRTRNCLQWTGDRYTETHLAACLGSNVDHITCELGGCPKHHDDFRAYQCRILSRTRQRSGNTQLWKPFQAGKPCDVYCKAEDTTHYNFGTAQDGTPCLGKKNHVCVQGQCLLIGCDGHVGVGTRVDMCGVCNGQNETCSHIRYTYRIKLPREGNKHRGYNDVVTIPRGSTHFSVKETGRNSIAVMNADKRFVLNGHYAMDKPGVYEMGGTRVTYDRVGHGYEALHGVGPTKEDLHVMLLYRQHNAGVKYEFWVPGKATAELADKTYYGPFDNAIPSDDVRTDPPVTEPPRQITLVPATEPPLPRQITLSDDDIWGIVMKEIDRGGLETHIYRSDSAPNVNSINTFVDTKQNETKERLKKYRKEERKKKRVKQGKGRRRHYKKQYCPPCKKVKNRNKLFCDSDFVSKVHINGVDVFGNSTRYDITILYTYRNIVLLLHREYLWISSLCKCPRMRVGREYIIMGMTEFYGQREIRLTVSPDSYVRQFSYKQDLRMKKLKRKRSRCKLKKKIF